MRNRLTARCLRGMAQVGRRIRPASVWKRITVLLLFALPLTLTACGGGPQRLAEITALDHPIAAIQQDINPPSSVEASCSTILGCEVSWSGQGIWDYVRIYRSTTNDFSSSVQVHRGWSQLPFWDRNVEQAQQYFYWARFEDRHTGELSTVAGSASACHYGCPATTTVVDTSEPDDSETDEPELDNETFPLAFPWNASEGRYTPERAYLLAEEALQAPVYHNGEYLFVGIDQGRDVLEKLGGSSDSSESTSRCTTGGCYSLTASSQVTGETDERGDWTLRYGEIQETRSLNHVEQGLRSYFHNTAQLTRSGSPVVMRFEEAPSVKFGGAITSTDVARLTTVLQIINSALPHEWKLEMATGAPEPLPEDLTGSIYVEFLPKQGYQEAVDSSSLGSATVSYSAVSAEIPHAHVQINRTYAKNGETEAAIVLAHELIHSLGIGHATLGMSSVMMSTPPTSASDLPLPVLYRDDRRALHALYSDMSPGDLVSSLGPWSDTVMHLAANGTHVAFGVAYADGYGEPWAYGMRPEMGLADNPDISGTASWLGMLLGFTSDDLPLSGNAGLTIQLDDLTGSADFTEMETWTDGSLPGEAGTGTAWSVGDLAYDILVTGNTFRQTGGDEGTVTGAFFGEAHDAAGGVLERTDLSAAFGATRQ